MIKTEKYVVGNEKDLAYRAVYNMTTGDDKYMHMRLGGELVDLCTDIYFVTRENDRGLSRVWMCYGKHDGAVCNWGAVYTPEECRGNGYCAMTLDLCFAEIDAMDNPPPALFCTAGEISRVYKRYGFVPALKGAEMGPMYRPCGNSPKTFQEFCEQYYTETDELFVIDADFGRRNEIDCLLRFALMDMGESFGIGNVKDLFWLLMDEPERAKIVLTKEGKTVGWSVDGEMQLHPKYRSVSKITEKI